MRELIPPLENKETATVVAGVSDPGYSLSRNDAVGKRVTVWEWLIL